MIDGQSLPPRDGAGVALPPPGGTIEVLPGLHWARLAMPLRLDHVNVWLLEDGPGWTLIDAGFDTPAIRETFDALLAGTLGGRPVTRVIITHGHPDHIGLAGTLCARFGVVPHMTLAEWLYWRMRHVECAAGILPDTTAWFRAHGVAPKDAARMSGEQEVYLAYHRDPATSSFRRVIDGEVLTIGGRRWTAITGGGHAMEHLSLYCAAERVLIAGDQILGRISPLIGVFPQRPEEDPLTEYLRSLGRFARLAPDALVLPSHGVPFAGLGARVAALREHHAERLQLLLDAGETPRPAIELATRLFSPTVMASAAPLALFETVAHLHCLMARGAMRREAGADGVLRFRRVDAAFSLARPGSA
jgi:glyoxylase-like metal-dependent hydrolase (beta-lactamase superfamily II)